MPCRLCLFIILGILAFSSLVFGKETPLASHKKWVVYYSDKEPVEAFAPYELCVFDSKEHPPLGPLKQQGKTLLGYISLGEVEHYRSHYEAVKKEGLLMDENPNWKGSYYVDVRDPRWTKRIVEELIPRILHKGFDGIFMDTLDNPEFLENKYPRKYSGMKQAAVQLVKAIRQNFPTIKIMMNRAFELLPDLATVIDMEMGEVTYTQYDFQNKKYLPQPQKEHEYYVKQMLDAKKLNPKLEIYTLDYWYKGQKEMIAKIYKLQRDKGFHPYVATIDLHAIIPEPQQGEPHGKG